MGGTNPERLPGGGGAELLGMKVRSRCVCSYWGHDGGREKQRQALSHPVSRHRQWSHTPQSQDKGEPEPPLSASGAGARSALISTAAAGALESPSLAHGLFVTTRPQFQPPCSVSGWLASHLTYRRPSTVLGPGPPVGAVPDTLGENTHA